MFQPIVDDFGGYAQALSQTLEGAAVLAPIKYWLLRTSCDKSTYKRNGTTTLFAALDVTTGKVIGKTNKTKTRKDFLLFMDEVVASEATGQVLHVVMDNLSSHKKCDAQLAQHPNVKFHYTPTSASWLNQVEIWFGIFLVSPSRAPAS